MVPMKFLKKLFSRTFVNYIKNIQQLRLLDEHIHIEETTKRPYFSIGCTTSFVADKLYVEDLMAKEFYYMSRFSKKDYGVIKHFMGGLKAFELGNFYTLTSINYETKEITVIDKQTLGIENWKLAEASNFVKYSQLDKESIFQLAYFYAEQKMLQDVAVNHHFKNCPQQLNPEDSIYTSGSPHLKLIKTS